MRRLCILLHLIIALATLACRGDDTTPVPTAPFANATEQVADGKAHILRILSAPGVIAVPADSSIVGATGDSVSYRFQAQDPSDVLIVRLDDKKVAAAGVVHLSQDHELVVIAQRTRSRAAAVAAAPAATAVTPSLEPTAAALAADVAQLDEQPAGVTPVTVIYVNGILNTYHSSFNGAASLQQALSATRGVAPGWPGIELEIASTSLMRFGARQPWRVVNQYNPTLKDQWCIGVLRDALDDSHMHLGWPALDKRVRLAISAFLIARKADPQVARCTKALTGDGSKLALDWLRLTARSAGVVAPQAVTELARFVDAERRSYGGRNVVIVAHSHGNMVAREALRRLSPSGSKASGTGCVGIISVAAPFGSRVTFDGANVPSHRVIARGSRTLVHDILYPLGADYGPYAKASARTRKADSDFAGWNAAKQALKDGIFTSVLQMQVALHDFESTYLGTDGYRDWVVGAVRQSASAMAKDCGGRVSGTIRDASTNAAIAGAQVEVWNATARLHALSTSSNGVYSTPTLPAGNYRLRVSAAGHVSAESKIVVQFNALATGAGVSLKPTCGVNDPVCDIAGTYDMSFTQILPGGYRRVGSGTAIVRVTGERNGIQSLDIRAAGPSFGPDAVNWPISIRGTFRRATRTMNWTMICVLGPDIPASGKASNGTFTLRGDHWDNIYMPTLTRRR